MPISVRRLAQLAGVNPMTVSRALRGREGVSDELRRKILALARKFNYPLPAARAAEVPDLLRVMAATVDIESSGEQLAFSFNRRLLTGMRQGAAECGTELALLPPCDDVWPLMVDRRQVDGVVLPLSNEQMPHPPFPPPVPAVFIFFGPDDADVVTVESFEACQRLGAHLAELGHRRVAYIGPETAMSRKRLFGLRAGLEPAGGAVPPECVRIRPFTMEAPRTRALVEELLQTLKAGDPGSHGFTALAAYNDYMAETAVLRLRACGVRVPEDVSVVGFDNTRPSPGYDGPALTAAAMPIEDIGAEAVRLLYWRIAHPSAPRRRLALAAPLVIGNSTQLSTNQRSTCGRLDRHFVPTDCPGPP